MVEPLERLFDLEKLRRNWQTATPPVAAVPQQKIPSTPRQILEDLRLLVQSEIGASNEALRPLWEQIEQLLLQQEQAPMTAKQQAAHRAQLRQALQDVEEMLDALLLFRKKDE